MVYTEKDFQAMLKLDEDVYANILQIEKQLQVHYDSWTIGHPISDADYKIVDQAEKVLEVLKSRYASRQKEYTTNTTYNFAKTTTQWVSDFTDDIMNFIGLGAIQIALPVAWVVGTAIVVGAVTFFCTKYFTQTQIDFNQGLETVADLAKVNPGLAQKMLDGLMVAKKEETKAQNSTAKQIVSLLAIFGLGYMAYTNRDKIINKVKSLNLKT